MTASTAARIQDVLVELLRTPTSVPAGSTEIPPGDPRLLAAIETVILPRIEALAPREIRRHPLGDVLARFGPEGDDGVLLQTYIVSQHGNLMDDAHAGRVADGEPYGLPGRCVVGKGAAQNKGPMAAAFAAVSALQPQLRRPVWLAVNTEGRSSHGGSQRIIDDLGVRAAWGVCVVGTDLAISLGNRGRVDVEITVAGVSCHSSQPWLGSNPIEPAADLVRALRRAPLPPPHPHLGAAAVTPYQISCDPIAPHTIPSAVRVVVDRRILPGEDITAVVDELRDHVRGFLGEADGGRVVAGVAMLPAVVDEDSALVAALRAGLAAAQAPATTVYSHNTFDAGYACAKGIPTCMFGPGRRSFSSALTQAEAVSLDDCVVAADALTHALRLLCG